MNTQQPEFDSATPSEDVMLWDALQVANIPTLIMVLVQLTGDQRWLEAPYTLSRTRGMDDNDSGGLSADLQEEVRVASFQLFRQDAGGQRGEVPLAETVTTMMTACMGEEVPLEYGAVMLEEMGLVPRDPKWSATPDPDALSRFRVLIIGAGVSGICAAITLRRAGIPFEVVEKSSSVGGTWLDNTYPGAGVDTPSHLYSFSFAPWNWSRYFAKQGEIRGYLEDCVDRFGVRDSIRLRTEVLSAEFDEESDRWTVRVRDADGGVSSIGANVVISAVGQLNQPFMPTIEGAARFRGHIMHSARWPADLDVTGKRVIVIGSGATAMQIVPTISDKASNVAIFQRSPQWAAPSANYKRAVPAALRYLMDKVPLYAAWYRCRLVWSFSDKVHESLIVDPNWPSHGQSINAANDGHRRFFTRHVVEQLGDRQDLLAEVLPTYPPFAKRMLIDNDWFRTVTKDNVEIVSDGVREITEDGVVDQMGQFHAADVIVYATGFQSLNMVGSYDVRGRTGRSLRGEWGSDDARAYLGITVRGFPNFFCLYGPNTGLGHGGSLIFLTECGTRYIVSMIERMIVEDISAVEVKSEVFERYNLDVDAAHETMIWTHPGTNNWYRNSRGRVVTNWPWRVVDYWRMTHDPDLSDFELHRPLRGPRVRVDSSDLSDVVESAQ